MIRLIAVALIVVAMLVIRHTGAAASEDARGTALALGFTLMVALVAGEFLRRFRLPRLTGYLLFGLLVGPYLGNVITEPMARQLQLVTEPMGHAALIVDPGATFGEVFTRRWVVDLILDLVGYTPDRDLASMVLVEPSCGSGAFLGPVVERLIESARAHGHPHRPFRTRSPRALPPRPRR